MGRVTVAGVDAELRAHERECAERYKRIEERLDSGQTRFNRLENMVWGIYGILIATNILHHIF